LVSLVCTYLLPETNGTALRSARDGGLEDAPPELRLPGGGR
jgi:hypothetical protein